MVFCARSVICLALIGFAVSSTVDTAGNPIRKVVTLLQDMQKEITAEGEHEKTLFDKFMCFCDGSNAELKKSLADLQAKVTDFAAKVEEETAEKAQLAQDLIVHKQEQEQAIQDLAKSTALRAKEQSEFEADSADQKANLEAISGAIPSIEKGMGGAAFMQLPRSNRVRQLVESSKVANSYDRNLVMSFLDQTGDYAPQSGQIVGILKAMKDDMEASLKETITTEESAVKGYGELKAAKTAEAAASKKAITTKSKRAADLAVSIVQNQDGLEDTTLELADTQKFLATLDVQCVEKKKEMAIREKLRAEEVAAISEAISIMNDDDALDVFKKAIPATLVQVPEFGFLQAHKGTQNSQLHKVQALIASATQIYRSPPLQLLAYSVSSKLRLSQKAHGKSKADFSEVIKMIDGMVSVLIAEQADDEKHKTFCVAEFGKSADELAANKEEITSLDSNAAKLADEMEMLVEDMKTLSAGVQELDKSVAVATEQRKEEHQAYTENLALTETAVALIEKAKMRLLKFYQPTLYKAPPKVEMTMEEKIIAAGTAFVQVNEHHTSHRRLTQPEAPEIFGAAYVQKSEKSAGVMKLMDMITKELNDSVKDAEYDEKTAQTEYTELMSISQTTRAADVKSINNKEVSRSDLQSKLTTVKESKALAVEKQMAMQSYEADLHVSCDFVMENFDMRKEARTNEMESLKNAKAMLSGANFGF